MSEGTGAGVEESAIPTSDRVVSAFESLTNFRQVESGRLFNSAHETKMLRDQVVGHDPKATIELPVLMEGFNKILNNSPEPIKEGEKIRSVVGSFLSFTSPVEGETLQQTGDKLADEIESRAKNIVYERKKAARAKEIAALPIEERHARLGSIGRLIHKLRTMGSEPGQA